MSEEYREEYHEEYGEMMEDFYEFITLHGFRQKPKKMKTSR